jgi:hypothetical protein
VEALFMNIYGEISIPVLNGPKSIRRAITTKTPTIVIKEMSSKLLLIHFLSK